MHFSEVLPSLIIFALSLFASRLAVASVGSEAQLMDLPVTHPIFGDEAQLKGRTTIDEVRHNVVTHSLGDKEVLGWNPGLGLIRQS